MFFALEKWNLKLNVIFKHENRYNLVISTYSVSNEDRVRGNEFKLQKKWVRLEVVQNFLNMNNEI